MVLAPNILFTCTNSSEAGGSLIDFCMHSKELTPYLRVEPWYDYGFQPHIVSLRYFADKEVLPETGWVIDAPLEISQTYGPRNCPVSKHWVDTPQAGGAHNATKDEFHALSPATAATKERGSKAQGWRG